MAMSGTQKSTALGFVPIFFLPSQPPFPFDAKDTVAVHQLTGSCNHYNPGNLGHIYHLLPVHPSCPFLSERRPAASRGTAHSQEVYGDLVP